MALTTPVRLLFRPDELLKKNYLLGVMELIEFGKQRDYKEYAMNARVLKKFFPKIPDVVKSVVLEFTEEGLERVYVTIQERYKKGRGGISLAQFEEHAILHHTHGLMIELRKYASLFKWFHQTGTGWQVRTAPCTFSLYRPSLQFAVTKEKDAGLRLHINVVLSDGLYPLEAFNQKYYLLESKAEYFILNYTDYQQLARLQQMDWPQYSRNAAAFLENVVLPLEENYIVERNSLFEEEVMEVTPVNRVMLSELSGAFLLLTPQWLYDGQLIEGPYQEQVRVKRGKKEVVLKRNKTVEEAFVQQLVALNVKFQQQLSKGYFYLSFADAQKGSWFLKAYQKMLAAGIELAGMDMLQHFRYSPHKAVTVLEQLSIEDSWATYNMQVTFGEDEVPLLVLQKTLLAGQKVVMLKDGSFGVLEGDWMNRYGTILKHGRINKKEIRLARWLALSEDALQATGAKNKQLLSADWWNKWKLWQTKQDPVYAVSGMVQATLRPYQQKGYEWMMLLTEAGAGACLADDMGLGKTLQTICFLVNRIESYPLAKCLIVTPASLIYNWLDEWKKFAPDIKVEVFHGTQRKNNCFLDDTQVVITSYGAVRADIDMLQQYQFGAIVIDESHYIKNPGAQITKAVSVLNGVAKVALSGTPVMNNTFDLYSQLNFVLPGMYGSREFFKREYADPIDVMADKDKMQVLQRITAPFILRRTKQQVATDLPDKTEMVLWCEMEADQQMAYDTIKEKIKSSVYTEIKQDGLQKGKLGVLNGLLKLRQLCDSAELVKDEDIFSYESIKTKMLIAELERITPQHKALVFSQFTSMLDLLEPALQQAGIRYLRLDGTVASKDRKMLVDEFQSDENDYQVFLISLKAGNAGLNLVAADYVFLFDPWWNKAVENQAIDRVHRIGQTRPVYAYRMVCKGTIEEKILALQARKNVVSDNLITADEGFVKSLDLTDIDFLFS